MTKIEQVKQHLLQRGSITSLDAIKLYNYTRLSAGIFALRKSGWDIKTEDVVISDCNGNKCTYAKYLFSTISDVGAFKKSIDAHLEYKPTGSKVEHKYNKKKQVPQDAASNMINQSKQTELF